MPRTYSSLDKIRAELAWVNETPDPNKCGCRNLRCCEESGPKPGACAGAVATKFWTFRWESNRETVVWRRAARAGIHFYGKPLLMH